MNLGLPSLEYRRIRGDLIETYKICHKIYDSESIGNLLTFATPSNLTERTRGHPYKLTKMSPKTNSYKYFFSNRITNAWNSLPVSAACATSLNSFKNEIDKLYSHIMYSTNLDIYNLPPPPLTHA